MNQLKEIYDSWGERMRSHLFGSIAISFALINWKVLYFLAFAKVSVDERIEYYDDNTSIWTLYILPIVLGSLFGLIAPFINERVHLLVSKPMSSTKARDELLAAQRDSDLEEAKARIAKARADQARSEAEQQSALVEQAKSLDKGLSEVSSSAALQLLSKAPKKFYGGGALTKLSEEFTITSPEHLTKNARFWLSRISQSELGSVSEADTSEDGSVHSFNMGNELFSSDHDGQEFSALQAALEELAAGQLVEKVRSTYNVTLSGHRIANTM